MVASGIFQYINCVGPGVPPARAMGAVDHLEEDDPVAPPVHRLCVGLVIDHLRRHAAAADPEAPTQGRKYRRELIANF